MSFLNGLHPKSNSLATDRRFFYSCALAAALALVPAQVRAVDATPPTVTGVRRSLPGEPNTTAATVIFRVSFSEAVENVSETSFDLTATGGVAGTIGHVWGMGTEWYVTVHTITGAGTLRLNVRHGTIKDAAGNLLAVDFTQGQLYGRLAGSTLVAWGDNYYGAIGDNSNIDRPAPVAVLASGVMSGQTMAIAAAGAGSSQALSREGKLFTWGYGYYGQLGNNQNINYAYPVAVEMDSGLSGQNVITVASGGHHMLALSRYGYVYAWGRNDCGQLGNGNNADAKHPQEVNRATSPLAGKRIVAISAGDKHSLALAHDGRVYAWGKNSNGQLGNNSTTDSNVPVAVDIGGALAGKSVVAIGAGYSFSAALTSDGKVYAWGSNSAGQLGSAIGSGDSLTPLAVDQTGALAGKTVLALAVGGYYCLVQASNGELYAWGFNIVGQLGNNSTTNSNFPVAVDMTAILVGKSIVAIAASGYTSFALDSVGRVYSWGSNLYSTLGQGASGGFVSVPGAVVTTGVLADRAVFALGSGGVNSHMLAMARDMIGFFQMIPPGNGTYATGASLDFTVNFTEPVVVTGTPQLVLTVGSRTVYADNVSISGSGNLVFRYLVQPGDFDADGITNGSIMLNGGTIRDRFGYDVLSAVPPQAMAGIQIDASSPVVTGSARFQPQATTTASGTVVFRVSFDRAVTGVDAADFSLATTGNVTGAVATVTGSGVHWYAVVAGVSGAGALRLDLKASGTGIMDTRGNPLTVGSNSGQFYLHTTATALAAWGNDDLGQLGLGGSGSSLLMPTAIPSGHALAGKTIAAMATGTAHTLALSSSGQVVAWGDNNHGALGDNSNDNSPVPVAVLGAGALGGKTVMAIAAAGGHSLALTSDGLVFAWGLNDAGQLGTNTGDVNVPTAVQTSAPLAGKFIVAIAAGGRHSLALASDGSLSAWGSNSAGQLGRASGSGDSPSPVAVDQTGVLAGKSVVAIAAGGNHSLALTADGRVFAWGQNLYGQLGDNSGSNQAAPVAVLRTGVLANQQIIAVAAGDVHSLALSATGQLFAWGENADGQIGDGHGDYIYASPTAVVMNSALANKTVTAIHAGARHNLVLCSTGQAFSWGDNMSYQLGNGDYGDAAVPIVVSTAGVLANQTLLATGGGSGAMHSIVLLNAATIPFTGIESWRNQYFATPFNSGLAADTADADGDGRPNLLEYALNSSPLATNGGSGTTLGASTKGTKVRHLTLSFDRIADPALVYRIEASNTLASESWTTVWSSSGANNIAETVIVHDNTAISSAPRRFLRLKVGF